jgi:thiol-disulfide isomerase/thioredoxin
MIRKLTAVFLALLAVTALANGPDPRGWQTGEAIDPGQLASMTQGLSPPPEISLPRDLIATLEGKTFLFYFSPTCPHCRSVADEVNALSKRLDTHATVVGVSSGGSSLAEILEFKSHFDIQFRVVHDQDRAIVSALGARSTPSAVLVEPKSKGKVTVLDVWYPYLPGFDAMVEGRARGDIWSSFRENEYKGDTFCGACHRVPALSWSLTHHSIAWRTLVLAGQDQNPECTGCHVTGNGKPSGWAPDPHNKMVNVGCEACHGPGGPHDGVRSEPRDTCEGCHDAKHAIAFSYEKGLPLIDHYSAQDLTSEDVHAERVKLYNGEVPRDLLAFADGKNLGPQACKSCHEAEVAWWESSAHHNAMAPLKAAESPAHEDPACVRCHATALASGPPPTTLAGFHLDTGVSCESCHGPGEAHVKAGGAPGTIEGLGEDCPVCVIEAVCTGCHTQEWDPSWDLDIDLPRVTHHPKAVEPSPPPSTPTD